MQALIDFIIRNMLAFWPIARVYTWQQGVRVRTGHLKEELEPGLHWRWPFIDEVYRVSRAEYTLDLLPGTITTRDGKSVTLSANLTYRIRSCAKMWRNVNDIDASIQNVGLGFLAALCSRFSWEELTAQRDEIQKGLAEFMTEQLDAWGVEVTRAQLTDMVQARPIRLFNDSAFVSVSSG